MIPCSDLTPWPWLNLTVVVDHFLQALKDRLERNGNIPFSLLVCRAHRRLEGPPSVLPRRRGPRTPQPD